MAECDFTDMLKQVREEIHWKIALHDDSRIIYRQNPRGYFEELSFTTCKMEVRKIFKLATPATIANLVNAILEDEERLFDDALFLESRRRGIGFLNGVFDLQTGQLREYSTTDFVCVPLPHRIPYDVDPETERFLLDTLGRWVVSGETADWMIDMLAYLLFIFPNEEQIWINFFGEGSNGKGVCLELMERILGDGKCVGCDLAHINRFSGDTFQGKWLVVGRDSSQYVSDTATSFIKTYSGDPKLLVEEKGGASYDIYNPGKLVVSTNNLIQSKDRTFSWYRRLVPIPFPNRFPRSDKFKQQFFQHLPKMIRVLLHRDRKSVV
jgi:phage/plasmid-associated DNA primase